RTSEIGGSLGARLTWRFLPGFAAHFGGTVGPVWMNTRFTGDNCLDLFPYPVGTSCGSSNSAFIHSSGAGSASTVGFRGTASLGFIAVMRYAVLSLSGFMRYDSQIPGMANPQQTNYAAAVAGDSVAPAKVQFRGGFAYGGSLTLRIPLSF
ncbi:MAG: hypothetical protein KIT16_12075, partial [Rhodospirillaceae bacterium]|nr:hypothetical protein [Rhodospirillaceae bacterium]